MSPLPTTTNAVKVAAMRQLNERHPEWPNRTLLDHVARCCAGVELLATRQRSC